MSGLPAEVRSWIGQKRYAQVGEFDVERGYILTSCASVENGNPLFWDEEAARAITGGWIAPPSMISVWFRPHRWAPGRSRPLQPLQVHFDLKAALDLPEAIMTDDTIVFREPVRPGDRLATWQVLRSISDEKETRLGRGRFWVIEVEYENQRGEPVGTESYTGFGYRRPASGAERRAQPRQGVALPLNGSGGERSSEMGGAESRAQPRQGAALPLNGSRGAALPLTGSGGGALPLNGPEAERSSGGGAAALAPRLTLDRVRAGDALPELAVDVTATTVVLGALASRDWRPMHHDRDFAQQRNGLRDIFINTPHNAAYFERFITDWTGPHGRLGRIAFRMKESVFPGDRMVFRGRVEKVETDGAGCGWVELALRLGVGERTTTECAARVALPLAAGDNPWRRHGGDWQP